MSQLINNWTSKNKFPNNSFSDEIKTERRHSDRLKLQGCVVIATKLTPIVALLHDIANGGCSFICHDQVTDAIDVKLPLDIIIYDPKNNSEYFLEDLKGVCVFKDQFGNQTNGMGILYHVRFSNPTSFHQETLQRIMEETVYADTMSTAGV